MTITLAAPRLARSQDRANVHVARLQSTVHLPFHKAKSYSSGGRVAAGGDGVGIAGMGGGGGAALGT